MSAVTDDNYFKSLAEELNSKFGRINSLVNQHPSEKGNYHEYLLKDFIQSLLPKRYSVKTGFIYVDDSHISPQIDLMIIDENQTPSFLVQYDDFVIVYPEAVCCVIEVKTFINKRAFKSATAFIRKIKQLIMYSNPVGGVIGGYVFGFESEEFSPRRLNNWYREESGRDISEYADGILSLNQGLITKWNLQNDNWGHYFVIGENGIRWKSLSIFRASILKFCELRAGVNSGERDNPFERYARIHELLMSREFLRYGSGLQRIE